MNNQEAYELIFDWLARPGATKCMKERVIGVGQVCAYSDGKGNHCAIGGPMKNILDLKIVDYADEEGEMIIGDYEGSIVELMGWAPEVDAFWDGVDIDFLESAQTCHDAPLQDEDWQNEALTSLNAQASSFDLKLKKIPA